MLYFLTEMPETLIKIFNHSQSKQSEFPLSVKMFEFTVLILTLMRNQKLYRECNAHGVFNACNRMYCAAFLRFSVIYIETGASIRNVFEIA